MKNRLKLYEKYINFQILTSIVGFNYKSNLLKFKICKFSYVSSKNLEQSLATFWFLLFEFQLISLVREYKPKKKMPKKYSSWIKDTSDKTFNSLYNISKRKKSFIIDKLVNSFLYGWRVQPKVDRSYISFDKKSKCIVLNIFNLQANEFKTPVLAKFQNNICESFNFQIIIKTKPNYNFLIIFYLRFFKILPSVVTHIKH